MTLCADIGNSAVKLALVHGGHVRWSATLAGSPRAEDIDATLRRARARMVPGTAAAMVSVRPALDARVAAALRRACGTAPLAVTHRTRLPIALAVRHPERLGTDRICAAVGALGMRRRGVIVVDVGTAITVDLVTGRTFRGGVIMAGPSLSLGALHAGTARLPRLDFAAGTFPPARIDATDVAMRWGAGLGAAGGIVAAVAMLQRRLGARLPVVVTGGAAGRIRPLLPARFEFRPHVTLVGLARIAELSKSS
ncbi:MAG TPA: type III pantothenate kinase [Candidatus Krumholzibacteria bacterium]|nr:type III pantothenate kinase [Candidatus Krumholzibacteria bacterium]